MIVDSKLTLAGLLVSMGKDQPPGSRSIFQQVFAPTPEEAEAQKKSWDNRPVFTEADAARVLATSGTGIAVSEYEQKNLANYKPRNMEQAAALKLANEWDPRQERGMILFGPVGTGKTHLVKGILIKWAIAGYRVAFVSLAALMDNLRDAQAGGGFSDALSLYLGPHILALDDFGAEKITDWAQEKILTIFDARLRHKRPLFITSNLSLQDLKQTYDIRILDRLKESVRFLPVPGDSFRTEIYRRNLDNKPTVENAKPSDFKP